MIGVYKDAGRTEKGMQLAQEVLPNLPETDYYHRACIEALLGHTDVALDLLEKSLEEDPSRRDWAQQDPDFRALHSHPRYRALVGLSPREEP